MLVFVHNVVGIYDGGVVQFFLFALQCVGWKESRRRIVPNMEIFSLQSLDATHD